MTKVETHNKIIELCKDDSVDEIIQYITDCFNTADCQLLLEHIRDEKGVNDNILGDDEY